MTLAFATHIDKAPTYFVEKVWKGLSDLSLVTDSQQAKYFDPADGLMKSSPYVMDYKVFYKVYPKLHTIREDSSNRWKVGMDIHMAIRNRSKDRFQFAPIVKCVSTQTIKIQWATIDLVRMAHITIGGKALSHSQMDDLARNDGFDSTGSFFKWFKEDFEGKIIHWTDLQY